jgi:hypothetical protein
MVGKNNRKMYKLIKARDPWTLEGHLAPVGDVDKQDTTGENALHILGRIGLGEIEIADRQRRIMLQTTNKI